jgi:hypothetical protein
MGRNLFKGAAGKPAELWLRLLNAIPFIQAKFLSNPRCEEMAAVDNLVLCRNREQEKSVMLSSNVGWSWGDKINETDYELTIGSTRTLFNVTEQLERGVSPRSVALTT